MPVDIVRILFMIIISLYSLYSAGQYSSPPLQELGDNSYTDGITEGKFHHFGHVFRSDERQAQFFSKFNHNRKVQRWINYTSAAIAVGGIIDVLRDVEEGSYVLNRLKKPLGYSLGIGVMGNLIAGTAKGNAKKRLLSQYATPINLEEDKDVEAFLLDFSGDFRQITTHRFQSDSIIGPLHRFEDVFSQSPRLSQHFRDFNTFRRKQIVGNVVGLGVTTISVAVGLGYGDIGGAQIAVYGGAGGLFYVLFSNLANGSKKDKSKVALLSLIDPHRVGDTSPANKLDIAMTDTGIGLVYRFN